MDKQRKLNLLSQQIDDCSECKEDTVGKLVFGEGNINADIMIIGEAPGKREAATGHPFVGRSGIYLRSVLQSVHIQPELCYITSVCKFLPVKGTPNKSQVISSKTYLAKQIEIINPRVLILLGAIAAQSVVGKKISISLEHGKIMSKNNRWGFVSYHPAAVLRIRKLKPIFERDFIHLREFLQKEQIL